MGATTYLALAIAGVALVAVVVLALLVRAERRRTATLVAALREELDALTRGSAAATPGPTVAEFVITDVGGEALSLDGTRGRRPARAPGERTVVDDRVVLSATLGEPLVKAAAFGHGLRRALSAESRNRIFFEMRREVRRARKQRRVEMKQAWRQMRSTGRLQDPAA